MLKRVLFGCLFVTLIGVFLFPSQFVFASSYDCEITIDANVHDATNYASMTGDCGMAIAHGYYNEQGFHLIGTVGGFVSNGEIVDMNGAYLKVNTIPLKKAPPKKEEKPKKESKPKQESTPKPKQESKPKSESSPKKESQPKPKPKESKPKPKQESKPKQKKESKEGKPKEIVVSSQKEEKGSSGSSTKNKQKSKSDDSSKGEKVEKDKKNKKKNKLSVKELADAGSVVEERDGKFIAIYKDEKGKEREQELKEEEAEELKEMIDEKENKLNKEEEEISNVKETYDSPAASSQIWIYIVILLVIALGGGWLVINKRKTEKTK